MSREQRFSSEKNKNLSDFTSILSCNVTFGYCYSISFNKLNITSFRNKRFKLMIRQFLMASNALKSNRVLHSLLTSDGCL